jgi:predicted transcriptional regulator YdeE
MSFDIIEQPERWIVGIATRTSNAAEMDPQRARLGRLWQRAKPGDAMVAVLTDYERGRDGEFTQVVGREVRSPLELAEGQVAVHVAAGSFAQVPCHGSVPEAIIAGWREVWAAEDRAEFVRAYRSDVELWPSGSAPTILVSVRQ